VEVRHLFYNVPARRKFLRTPATEMGHLAETFTRLALARSGLHLTLRHNGKLVHDVPGSMGLLDRIALLFGAEVANGLYRVHAEGGGLALAGYVGDPSCDRGTAQLQYLVLNGRWVRDRRCFQAVQDAYQGLLMTGRYPAAFLSLTLPPEEVDVNVHPAKAEVRFRDPEAVYRFVREAVGQRLRQADLTARLHLRSAKAAPDPVEVATAPARRLDRPDPLPLTTAGRLTPVERAAVGAVHPSGPSPTRRPPDNADVPPTTPAAPRRGAGADLFPHPGDAPAAAAPATSPGRPPPVRAETPPALQVLDCYLVVEASPDEVLFIDQHALHERILFEQLRARFEAGAVEAQRLLVPEPVELPPLQAAQVLEHRAALAELGLTGEAFGGHTVLLHSYPALLNRGAPGAILQAVADYLAGRERPPDRGQLLYGLLSLMACHAAVRAGDRLTAAEITALVAQRELARDGHHCPHGRPTTLAFHRRDLERLFRRT
jgi:DNA mismatch repair protein MutL